MISITLESVSRVDIEDEWNFSNDTEFTMHSIHTYPAKFPAFIAKKAFDYAKAEGVNIKKVADIFCGCGTVALEAKMHGKDYSNNILTDFQSQHSNQRYKIQS